MIKRWLVILALAVFLLNGVLLFRTLAFRSRQIDVSPTTVTVDVTAAAERLAEVLKFRTVSYQDSSVFELAQFEALHQYLERAFPRVHRALLRETVGGASLLYTWLGSDTSLPPVVLMAHQDVVPVEPGTEGDWAYPPFSGAISGGYVWGRGAIDDKSNLTAQLEAVELLLGRGYRPRPTVLLAYGHDEEVGGLNGAAKIAALLEQRGVQPAFVVDEGGAVAEGIVPGLASPVAAVGIAEKGHLSLELRVRVDGGHSSMPPFQTAIGILARALERLERHQMPRGLRPVTATMFDYLGPELPFLARLVVANRWLFEPIIVRQFGSTAVGNAMLRTTAAPTIFRAGVKENVLPSSASAVLNFRILPGDSIRHVLEHVRRTIDDPRVEIRMLPLQSEASPASSVDSEFFRSIARSIRQVIPEAVVVPWLVVGGTDSRHFSKLTPNVYRVSLVRAGPGDLSRIHGTDERVGIENYGEMVRFYVQLLQHVAM
jgi:carboxypeptidase PM20D1